MNDQEAKLFLQQMRNVSKNETQSNTKNCVKIIPAYVISVSGQMAKVRLVSDANGVNPFTVPIITSQSVNSGDYVNLAYWDNLSTAVLFCDSNNYPNYPHVSVRPNLLINPFFKVNQRGQSTYAASGWTVDGWYNGAGSDGSLTPNQNGALLKIQRTGIAFYQAVDPIEKNLTGKHVLFSILYTGTPRLVISRFDDVWHHYTSVNFPSSDTPAIATVGADIGDVTTNDEIRCAIYSASGSTSIQVYGTKFEVGMQQSLAYQDDSGAWQLLERPDPLEELKCKRYQQVILPEASRNTVYVGTGLFNTNSGARIFVPYPVPLRTRPSISFNGNFSVTDGLSSYTVSKINLEYSSVNGASILVGTNAASAGGHPAMLRIDNDATGRFIFDANL